MEAKPASGFSGHCGGDWHGQQPTSSWWRELHMQSWALTQASPFSITRPWGSRTASPSPFVEKAKCPGHIAVLWPWHPHPGCPTWSLIWLPHSGPVHSPQKSIIIADFPRKRLGGAIYTLSCLWGRHVHSHLTFSLGAHVLHLLSFQAHRGGVREKKVSCSSPRPQMWQWCGLSWLLPGSSRQGGRKENATSPKIP